MDLLTIIKNYHLVSTNIPFTHIPLQKIQDNLLECEIHNYEIVHLTYSAYDDTIITNIGNDIFDIASTSVIGVFFHSKEEAMYFTLKLPEKRFFTDYE